KRATVEEAFKTPNQIKATKYSNPVLDFVSTAVAGGMIDPLTYLTGATAGSILKSVLSKAGLAAKVSKGAATIADIAEATGKTEKELHALVVSDRAVQIEKANQTLSKAVPVVKSETSLPAGIGKITPVQPKTIVAGVGKQTPIKNELNAGLKPVKPQSNIISQPEVKPVQNGANLQTFVSDTPTHTGKIMGKDINIMADEGDGVIRYTIKDPTGRDVKVALPKAEFDARVTDIKPVQNGKYTAEMMGTVGKEPIIPLGQKERGFSANTRTDVNNPDTLRDSYSTEPLTYEQLGNPTTLAKAQAVFDQGHTSAVMQLNDLASKMQPEAIPLAKMLSRQATEAGNIQGAREIISNVAEKLTQAGQFSQAARILREADPETFLMTIDKQLKKLNKEGLGTYGKKWNNMDLTPSELDMVSKIERGNQASYESAFEAIQGRIANEMPSSAMEKINAWRHMSMLLNPKTHIRNVGGNAIMMGMRKVAQRVSGVIQKVFLKAEDRTQAVFVNKEFKQAATDYYEANKKDLLSGANKYNEGISLNIQNKRVFKNNALEKTSKFNYKLLEMGDTPFYKNAYIDRLASYAQAKGIKDFSLLKQEAFDTAKMEAEQATYKDASAISTFLNKVKHPGKNASFGQKTSGMIIEAALPFTKTPINIIKRGIQYSPAGIINGISKIKSAQGAAAAIDEMAKGLTGTGILGLGYMLASKGVLTGKAENDADLKTYNANTGHSPFSVLGKYTYDWMQPFSVPLTVGVEIYNAVKDNPQDAKKMDALIQSNNTSKMLEIAKKFSDGMLNTLNASGDTVFNMSIMKGVKQLLGGYGSFMNGMAQLPQNYATQFIPTVLNQTAGTIDKTVRQTYYPGNMPESVKATMVSKIPFASKTLEAKQTPFGEDVKRIDNPLLRAFSQFLSPGIISVPQDIPQNVDVELRRLNTVGEVIQFPTVAANNFIWKGQKFNLTPKEYTDFQKTLGKNTLAAYENTIKTSNYQTLNDNEKAKELSSLISDAKDLAKFQLIKNKGLSSSEEIMKVPSSLTANKIPKKLTFEQQNRLADNIAKYKKMYSLNKLMPKDAVTKKATDRAETEMKRELFSK
ncbi:MAG TPA: hypothetical protein VIK78_14375, partial [Ruminiclostridium sp.]